MSRPVFGFTVEYVDEPWLDEDNKPGWKVSLPNQCDGWRIDADDEYSDPSTQQTALYALDKFIAEAQRAREALAAGREYPGEGEAVESDRNDPKRVDLVAITLDNEKLGELLDHLDATYGPIPDDALARAEQDWPTIEEQP
ncbi:hypothetical protein OG689_10700 [Kitasatospora sp. NBC_00240]|uniref:hypothetical protein n=1 Tax=Kitasatospora sp. NBC_00240 TaxID=2903567 RepID=UPI002259C1CC|nr:hypothetical protein [Kitasatospora sp. NBC_00240]MCX5209752.1 hypothetical protein [Kitasatospora sp. NBC_00240]